MIVVTPTREQQLAIDCAGSMVAIARPGSGKTYVLSEKIKHILDGLPHYRGVIAISYTKKASAELKRRASVGIADVKASFFGTIDRFACGEIVLPFLSHIWGRPQNEVAIHLIKELPDEEKEAWAWLKENQLSLADLVGHISQVKRHYEAGVIFLETVCALSLYLLEQSEACRRYIVTRYSHVIIDEYQDSGLEQHQLFLELNELGLIAIAVGDADQSIFQFADKSAIHLLSLRTVKGFNEFSITLNHRCHASIVDYSLKFLKDDYVPGDGSEIRVFSKKCAGGLDKLVEWISGSISAVRFDYDVEKLCHIGILVKSNATLAEVGSLLKLPHRVIYTHKLEDAQNPWARLFCELLSYRFSGGTTIQEILEMAHPLVQRSQIKLARLKIVTLRTQTDSDLFSSMEAVAEILLPGHTNKKTVKLLEESKMADLERAFSAPSDGELQVMTIHKAKGSEFDVVFHLDLYDWVLPGKSKRGGFLHYTGLEQDTHLHYVGITRAKKALFLCLQETRLTPWGSIEPAVESEFLGKEGLPELRVDSPY